MRSCYHLLSINETKGLVYSSHTRGAGVVVIDSRAFQWKDILLNKRNETSLKRCTTERRGGEKTFFVCMLPEEHD